MTGGCCVFKFLRRSAIVEGARQKVNQVACFHGDTEELTSQLTEGFDNGTLLRLFQSIGNCFAIISLVTG